jgi:hypothetical protein
MKKSRIVLMTAILLNIAVVAMDACGNSLEFSREGFRMLQFYTVDSNILVQLACAVTAVCLILELARPGFAPPAWVRMFKYIAVCCTTVTFVVVVAILAPMYGGAESYRNMLLTDSMLYHHLLCPLTALFTLLFLDGGPELPRRAPLAALVPTLVYAAVTVVLNAARLLEGPYPFLMVYRQPLWMSFVWCAVILSAALVIAEGVRAAADRLAKLRRTQQPAAGASF